MGSKLVSWDSRRAAASWGINNCPSQWGCRKQKHLQANPAASPFSIFMATALFSSSDALTLRKKRRQRSTARRLPPATRIPVGDEQRSPGYLQMQSRLSAVYLASADGHSADTQLCHMCVHTLKCTLLSSTAPTCMLSSLLFSPTPSLLCQAGMQEMLTPGDSAASNGQCCHSVSGAQTGRGES